ncbi:nucleoprotein TPR [Microdochium nivale]|nr:nucleoprotein TPR [Microdochium nivale]
MADIDVGYLAAHLGVPQDNISTVVTSPTTDLVTALLSAFAAKAYEFDELYTQKVQLEVQLETSVRGAEAQRDASNERAAQALRELEEIRTKLKEEETSRQSLENELQTIRSSSSTSQSEVEKLKARIVSLETSNREALAIIDTKNSANESLSQELQAQHQKNLKLSQEITSMQQNVQNISNTLQGAKFKEQSLQQQLDMAQRSSDFFENELKTKTAEGLKFRKEKGARIAELQRQNDDATSMIESLRRTETQLRQRIEAAQKKAEDALIKVQQLQEAAARREEDSRQQSDSLQRLVDLHQKQAETHRNRVQEVEAREEQIKRECEDQVRRVNESLERANSDRDEYSEKADTLQAEVGRLEAMLADGTRNQPVSMPQTPRVNGSPFRPASPLPFTPGSMRKTMGTQHLEEYYKIKGLLGAEKQRSNNLAKELDDVIEQLEAKGPELEELQADNERLQQELKTISHLSDESFTARDNAKKAARRAEAVAATAQAELKILRTQLRDMGAQVQMLVFNVHALEKGYDQLTIEETLHMQRLERGQLDDENGEPSDVNTMILRRLVVFKNIQELQEKNEQLLQVTHELGDKMESDEAVAAKNQAIADHKEVAALHQKIKIFADELGGLKTRADSIMKERDMFRRIVESRASADELASALGRPRQDGVFASIEQNPGAEDGSDYATLLRELQQNFDTYRNEHTVDRKTMKDQVERLSSEKNSLQAELSKVTSQLTLASERFEMLQSNFVALQNENKELQIRNQSINESAAKQDIRTQQVAEDLIEARGQLDSFRSENANLKAEKKLWKDIQERMAGDNENLMQEKSRLNGLLATQQTLQNERELSEAETKRRMQTQVDNLEAELNATKRKLNEEVDEAKKAQLRKEFDTQQAQKRIDELTSNLSQIREELVATKTTRDHLQSRVDGLAIELRSAEERAERLQPRPTPRPGSMAVAPQQGSGQPDADERIQGLIHEVTDLKRDLELTQAQLENAKEQAGRYQELSQASEEELERMNSAQEQYNQEIEASFTAKDATIRELEQRIEDISAELTRSNGELSSIRDAQAEVTRHYEEEKTFLKEEIKRLKDEDERYTASAQFHQQDLRAQAEIARNAQEAYESEVMKHGQTAQALSVLRTEHNQLKTTTATWKAEAESAKTSLLSSESSWEERRQKFEQELSELRARRDDANAQNKLLHQQLENVNTQIAALQQSRDGSGDNLEAIAAQPSSTSDNSLRELSTYLRREKEILEVQYELKVQEVKRLQQQFEYSQSQLDEARLKLEQERHSHSDNERNSMSHKELMKKLEELNVFRESSAALRQEARDTRAKLEEKTAKIAELEASIQPLEGQIEELQSQQSFKDAEMRQLHEDRDRWQKRTEDILSKHGRTDPAEIENLKERIITLEQENAALRTAESELKERVQSLEKTMEENQASWQLTRERLINSAKEKARQLMAEKREVVVEKDQLQQDFQRVNSELSSAQEEVEASRQERANFEEQINRFRQQVEALQEEAKKNTTAPGASSEVPAAAATATLVPAIETDNAATAELQAQLSEARASLERITAEKQATEAELESLRAQLANVTAERDQAIASASAVASNGDVSMSNGTDASPVTAAVSALSDEERASLEQKIAAAETKAAEFEAKALEVEENIQSTLKARSDKMKDALNKKLNEYKSQMEEQKTQSAQEKEKLEADFKLRMDQERKIWELENNTAAPQASGPPETPIKQQPSEALPTATPSTPIVDVNSLGDKEIRDLISNNNTIKSIMSNNIRAKLAAESKKLRDELSTTLKLEWEPKVAQAREQAEAMAESKSKLRINMAENRSRMANAKLTYVETAAKETPQRAVAEVWTEAKDVKPPPPPAAAPTVQAQATNNAAPAPAVAAPPGGQPVLPAPATGIPKPGAAAGATNIPNPFATSQSSNAAALAAANPFGKPAASDGAATHSAPTAGQQAAGQPASLLPAPKASGIPQLPVPATRGRGGAYQAPRGAAARGGPQRGGRGGQQGGRNSMNGSAAEFQPGNKRPRGETDAAAAGNGAKRARGGGVTGP